MTRLEALTELRDKVKADAFTPEAGGPVMPSYRRFMALADIALPQDVRAIGVLAHDASRGSLDAAKALHEAVLPGFLWHAAVEPIASTWFVVGSTEANIATGTADNPARAWLLAILEALIAQEQAP